MVLFAIIEGGIVFFTTATLDNAVNDVGRLIRTGQAQTANMTTTQLVQTICGEVVFVSNCTTNLKLDVRTYSSFSSVAFPTPVDSNGNLVTTLQFNMGSAGDIVLVRAFYVWNVLSPLPTGLANNTGSSRLIQSSVAFRNEPYSS
jgi:Flp pilus assembly protein TadG